MLCRVARTCLLATLVLGCSGDRKAGDGGGGGAGGAGGDAGSDAFTCGDPNPIGVGATCTKAGGQCRMFGSTGANQCSCDYFEAQYCGCSKFCDPMKGDGDCGGAGARCCPLDAPPPIGRVSICVPAGCLVSGECPTVPDGGP